LSKRALHYFPNLWHGYQPNRHTPMLLDRKLAETKTCVTICPWCERNSRDAAIHYGLDLAVYVVAEIVDRAP
jgi:hypothetical protein